MTDEDKIKSLNNAHHFLQVAADELHDVTSALVNAEEWSAARRAKEIEAMVGELIEYVEGVREELDEQG